MLTLDATYVTSSSANLNGTVNPQGSPGSAFFLWGTTPTLSSFPDDNNTPLQSVVVNFTAQSFTASLTGLATGMTYYYQIGFFNAANSSYQYGPVLSFGFSDPKSFPDIRTEPSMWHGIWTTSIR